MTLREVAVAWERVGGGRCGARARLHIRGPGAQARIADTRYWRPNLSPGSAPSRPTRLALPPRLGLALDSESDIRAAGPRAPGPDNDSDSETWSGCSVPGTLPCRLSWSESAHPSRLIRVGSWQLETPSPRRGPARSSSSLRLVLGGRSAPVKGTLKADFGRGYCSSGLWIMACG